MIFFALFLLCGILFSVFVLTLIMKWIDKTNDEE